MSSPGTGSGDVAVIIPAIKKTVAFPDDLVKKLAGITLIQRALGLAAKLADPRHIFLVTDSQEIQLIGQREGVSVYQDAGLRWEASALDGPLYRFLLNGAGKCSHVLLLSAYAPLLTPVQLREALDELRSSGRDFLKPVKLENRLIFDQAEQTVLESVFGGRNENHRIEYKGFSIFSSGLLDRNRVGDTVTVQPWEVDKDVLEINSYQDWWICEKLLQRKRIVFRVIGNERVGMGHIYRALSLAREITDHEVLFVSDTENQVAVNNLAGYDYWLGIYEPDQVIDQIIALKPDLVINDILNTGQDEIRRLQDAGIGVVNFEDMGSGAAQADLTINELYDEPRIAGDHILWGHGYFFIRDEFLDARSHRFRKQVDSLLLTFGGTDQHDLSRRIFHLIHEYCKQRGIAIHIVTGPGYEGYDSLQEEISGMSRVSLTHASGVMSHEMERCQIAITSNGRTVYELAHMNIPSVVISQHEREKTHAFSREENGFIATGVYRRGETEGRVMAGLKKLVEDDGYRKTLLSRMTRFRFHNNKKRVLKKINTLLVQGRA